MTLSIHLTLNWPYEKIAKYGPEITTAMKSLAERFPDEITVKDLAKDIITGQNQLWLILDGEEFVAFVTSEIKVTEETGKKTVLLGELAGRGGIDLVPLIGPIEDWARSIGAASLTPIGRDGWRKALAKAGYKVDIVRYRKELADG